MLQIKFALCAIGKRSRLRRSNPRADSLLRCSQPLRAWPSARPCNCRMLAGGYPALCSGAAEGRRQQPQTQPPAHQASPRLRQRFSRRRRVFQLDGASTGSRGLTARSSSASKASTLPRTTRHEKRSIVRWTVCVVSQRPHAHTRSIAITATTAITPSTPAAANTLTNTFPPLSGTQAGRRG